MKKSLAYIIFEGFSKGGSQLLLIFLASFVDSQLYITLMLFLSIETLLKMILPNYYSELLFKLKDKFPKEELFSTINIVSLLISGLVLTALFFLRNFINEENNYDGYTLYLVLIINVFLFNLFRFNSTYFQLLNNHRYAIINRSVPFFLSFIFSALGTLFLEDKVLGFFLGKTVGFLIFLSWSKNKIKIKISFKKEVFKAYYKRLPYSFLNAWLGWIVGIGFLNIMNLFVSDNEAVKEVGLVLNGFSILLLLAYGINQVYAPKLKAILDNNKHKEAKQYSWKIHKIFILISVLMYFLLFFTKFIYVSLENTSLYSAEFYEFLNLFEYAIVIFLISSFTWVVTPYYFILDRFNNLFLVNLLGVFIASIFAFIFILNNQPILAFVTLLSIKSLAIYLFFIYKIKGNDLK